MHKDKIAGITKASETLAKNMANLVNKLSEFSDQSGQMFDIGFDTDSFPGSPSTWLSQVSAMDGIIQRFDQSSHHLMVPIARLNKLESCIAQANNHVNGLDSTFFSTIENGGGLAAFNYDNFHAQTNNGQNHNLQGNFRNVGNAIEAVLEAYLQVLTVLRPTKANYSFQAAANAFSGLVEDMQSQYAGVVEQNSSISEVLQTAEQASATIQGLSRELQTFREEGSKDRETLAEHLTDATEKTETISTVHGEATGLEKAVQDYKGKFEAFDQKISQRDAACEAGTAELSQLINDFQTQKESVAELIEQSEQMLKGATVAGLAGRFEEIRGELTTELHSARRTFYWGIGFLFLSAIPLMAFVFLPIIAPILETSFPSLSGMSQLLSGNATATGWQYLGQVLARFIILLPAAWFVSFTAIRHSSLFRLREHYAYKYSMAVSVEGFKKQAKGYEDEIAAMVLEQLAFNPADKLVSSKDIKEGKMPNPVMEFVLRKLRRKSDDAGDCAFRDHPDADSDFIRTLIPIASGHDSGVSGQGVLI